MAFSLQLKHNHINSIEFNGAEKKKKKIDTSDMVMIRKILVGKTSMGHY